MPKPDDVDKEGIKEEVSIKYERYNFEESFDQYDLEAVKSMAEENRQLRQKASQFNEKINLMQVQIELAKSKQNQSINDQTVNDKNAQISKLEEKIEALQKLNLNDDVANQDFDPNEEFQEIKELFEMYKSDAEKHGNIHNLFAHIFFQQD